jgi:rod shape-determining protein MreD
MNETHSLEFFRIRKEHKDSLKIAGYALLLLIVQTHFVANLSQRAFRLDLLLPTVVGIAIKLPYSTSILLAFVLGYVVDVLSGKFWGLHVGAYVLVVLLVHMTAQKIEFRNLFYQISFIGVCMLGQSFVLGLLLWIKASTPLMLDPLLKSFGIRSVLNTLIAPIIIAPILRMR